MSTPIKINKGLKKNLPKKITDGQINFCTDTGESQSLKYSQGSTSYGYVTSTSSSAYPANGRYSSDGYWYVKIA